MIQEQYLDKVVEQLVGETIIDHDNEGIIFPFLHSRYNATFRNFKQLTANIFMPLGNHTHSTYGLTEDEYQYVWRKYKSIILDKIKNKPLFALIDGKRLNESEDKQEQYLDKIVDFIINDTVIKPPLSYTTSTSFPYDAMISTPFSELQFSRPKFFNYREFSNYYKNIYGLTEIECESIWGKFINRINKLLISRGIKDPIYH